MLRTIYKHFLWHHNKILKVIPHGSYNFFANMYNNNGDKYITIANKQLFAEWHNNVNDNAGSSGKYKIVNGLANFKIT